MKPFGIAAFVFSIFGVIIPLLGPFISALSGFLAYFSAGKGSTWGGSAIIINLVNTILLSPSLIIAMHEKNPLTGVAYNNPAMLEHSQKSQTIFGILILIQLLGLVVFLVVWLLKRKKQQMSYSN